MQNGLPRLASSLSLCNAILHFAVPKYSWRWGQLGHEDVTLTLLCWRSEPSRLQQVLSTLESEDYFPHQIRDLKTQTAEILQVKICWHVSKWNLQPSFLFCHWFLLPNKFSISWLLWNILTDWSQRNNEIPSLRAFIVIYTEENFKILL